MQGWRISMEDAHAAVLNLNKADKSKEISFFGVYDGHGGANVARYTGRTLHTRLAELPEFERGDYENALRRAFIKTDEDLRIDPVYSNDSSGCTAVTALFVSHENNPIRRIIVANAGDSRCVLGFKGKAKPLSFDHKPGNPEEHSRILNAGGFVEFDRVNGNLALSRAIGDFEFKQNNSLPPESQIVTAEPEIITHDPTGEEEFLVLACDGIWDCLSNQQVVDIVRRGIARGLELDTITEDIIDHCLAPDAEMGGIGCDNMTLTLVAILGGRTKEQWYAWVKERVDNKYGNDTPEEIPPVFRTQQRAQAISLFGAGGARDSQVPLEGGLLSAIPQVLANTGGDGEEGEDGFGAVDRTADGSGRAGSVHDADSDDEAENEPRPQTESPRDMNSS